MWSSDVYELSKYGPAWDTKEKNTHNNNSNNNIFE